MRGPVPEYSVGARVVYTPQRGSPQLATVRWVGEVARRGVVGIEFDTGGLGKHDGEIPELHERHFKCASGKGLYVSKTSSRLRLSDDEGGRDAQERRKRLSHGLEAMSEDQTLRQASATVQAQKEMVAAGGCGSHEYRKHWDPLAGRYVFYDRTQPLSRGLANLPRGGVVISVEGGPDAPLVYPAGYDGPRLSQVHDGVVLPEEARALYEYIRLDFMNILPASLMLALARAARHKFQNEPTVNRIEVPAKGKLVVVGDTHGHIKDFMHITRTEGRPGQSVCYLFNGDICDRADSDLRGGQQALHIWTCVLAYKLCYPDRVFMNRGNHEDALYWRQYGATGFSGEIEAKYHGEEAAHLVDAFNDLCECLPLCHVIGNSVLVTHGGLPRYWEGPSAVRLSEIEMLKRPLIMPARPSTRREHIIYDLAWADPQESRGVGKNDRGGSIVSYGPDVTKAFLQAAGLRMMIRSHEVPGRQPKFDGKGYEWWHPVGMDKYVRSPTGLAPLSQEQNGWCLTVFSASDYCGFTDTNPASRVVFTEHVSNFRVVEHFGWEAEDTLFTADPADSASFSTLSRSPRVPAEQRCLSDSLLHRELIEVIINQKHQLLQEFSQLDTKHDWHLPLPDFLTCCARVLPRIPWDDVASDSSIVPRDPAGVRYTTFLMRYQLRFRNQLGKHAGFRRSLTDRLFESLLRADRSMRDTFELIDTDGDGVVSVEEFACALGRFGQMMHQEQAQALYRTTIASEGNIRVEDFLGGLSMRFAISNARPVTGEDAFIPKLLDGIGREILDEAGGVGGSRSVPVVLREFFERSDSNRNGFLETDEFIAAIAKLEVCRNRTADELRRCVGYIDRDGNGIINYLEMLSALSVRHADEEGARRQGPRDLLEDLLEAVYRVLHFEYKGPLRTLIHRSVRPGSTRCSAQLFGNALRTLNRGAGGGRLTEQQIECLTSTLDADVDAAAGETEPHFDFEDYFNSFEIVDTQTEGDEAV